MTKKEITEYVGKFGRIEYNGSEYDFSTIHGYLHEIVKRSAIIKLAEGKKIKRPIRSIQSFTELPDPKR